MLKALGEVLVGAPSGSLLDIALIRNTLYILHDWTFPRFDHFLSFINYHLIFEDNRGRSHVNVWIVLLIILSWWLLWCYLIGFAPSRRHGTLQNADLLRFVLGAKEAELGAEALLIASYLRQKALDWSAHLFDRHGEPDGDGALQNDIELVAPITIVYYERIAWVCLILEATAHLIQIL